MEIFNELSYDKDEPMKSGTAIIPSYKVINIKYLWREWFYGI